MHLPQDAPVDKKQCNGGWNVPGKRPKRPEVKNAGKTTNSNQRNLEEHDVRRNPMVLRRPDYSLIAGAGKYAASSTIFIPALKVVNRKAKHAGADSFFFHQRSFTKRTMP